jgi:hypothetical protein
VKAENKEISVSKAIINPGSHLLQALKNHREVCRTGGALKPYYSNAQ